MRSTRRTQPSGRAALLVWGRAGVPEKDAVEFFNAASEPKQLRWYDTGHAVFDIQVIADRARFLADQLALRPVDPILRVKIGVSD